ncbi:hypothetical protein E4U55_005882 [Claviceps digitariae]|nr:hypothetical protein E4U55_005882 [Claviceps digitariae]
MSNKEVPLRKAIAKRLVACQWNEIEPFRTDMSSSSQKASRRVCDRNFPTILTHFNIIFVVDDARRGCEQQYNDVADAVTQFTANHFNKPDTGIDLYFTCSESGLAGEKGKYGGGFYSLQKDAVRSIFDERRCNYAEIPPSQNDTVVNIIAHYLPKQRKAVEIRYYAKSIIVIVISSDVPWTDPDSIMQQVEALNELGALPSQVSVCAIQTKKGGAESEQWLENEDEIKEEDEAMEERERQDAQTAAAWDQMQAMVDRGLRACNRRDMVNFVRKDEIRPGVLTLSAEGLRVMLMEQMNCLVRHMPFL